MAQAFRMGSQKKRERLDQITTAGKKVQLMEECTSFQKQECTEKLVNDGGGLASTTAVEQLLLEMKQGRASALQRIEVAKTLLAASKGECLKKFVSLGGVSILEEWIQHCAKIRSTDAMLKDSDGDLDEEIMVILQALEKLPISLETLKGCSIGKSVKQLRSVRNGEIQKKAKKLVDSWKKRVDIEIEQNCTQSPVVTDRQQQIDAVSYASDHSLSKVTEGNNEVAVKSGDPDLQKDDNLVNSQVLKSTFSDGATLDGLSDDCAKHCAEKEAAEKSIRLLVALPSSVSCLNSLKKQKLSSTLCTDKDCKDEASNSPDYQNLKEKDPKGQTSSNHVVTEVTARKTNEYRKKLRSGASMVPLCSTESNTMALPGNAAQCNPENFTSIGSNECNMEQQHMELLNRCPNIEYAGLQGADEASDLPDINDRDTGNKGGDALHLHMPSGKVEHENESCLSSQSSCSNKQVISGADGFNVEKLSLLTPPFQNVSALKLTPDAEPNAPNEDVANILSEGNGSVNVTRVVEGAAADHEESCCSQNMQMYRKVGGVVITAPEQDEKVERITAERSSKEFSVQEAVGTHIGAACFESTKFISNNCQEPTNKTANSTKESPLATNGNISTNVTMEIDKGRTVPPEVPAFAQSCHDFDLNERLAMEEFGHETQLSCGEPSSTSGVVPTVTGTLSVPIAVSAATKGAFIHSLNVPSKSDIGWRGSAATSAFRRAEPRHASFKMQPSTASLTTEARYVVNFDLNVADHDSVEDPQLLYCQGLHKAHLDLNCGGKVNETPLISDFSKHRHASSPGNCGEKQAVFDFDLNEQLNEVPQDQVNLPIFASKTYDGSKSYWGSTKNGTCGDFTMWNSADGAFYPGSAAVVGPKTELNFPVSAIQPEVSSRQVTPAATYVSPPSTSFVFSQAAPFFGGLQQMSFPASFAYTPISLGPDTPFMVSRAMPSTIDSSVGGRSGTEMCARPAFLANIDDLRGDNIFAWGGAPQNIHGISGGTIISYNDAAGQGRENVMKVDGTASVEEQVRIFQQAGVPVSSLKRREPDYLPGLKQSWH